MKRLKNTVYTCGLNGLELLQAATDVIQTQTLLFQYEPAQSIYLCN